MVMLELNYRQRENTNSFGKELEQLISRTDKSFKQNNAAVQFFDASWDAGLGAATVATAGQGALILGGIKIAKDQAVNLMKDSILLESKKMLSRNVDMLLKKNNLTYEELQNLDYEEFTDAIDKAGYLDAALLDNSKSQEMRDTIKRSSYESLRATDKALLDKIYDVNYKTEALVDVVEGLIDFNKITINKVRDLEGRMRSIEKNIDDLNLRMNDAIKDIDIIGRSVFDSASTKEKLNILRSGWNSSIDEETRKLLIDDLKIKQEKENIINGLADFRAGLGSATTLVKNLNIGTPEFQEGLSKVNLLATASQQYLSGGGLNSFAALSTLSGLAGGKADPVQQQLAAILSYMKQEFDRLNKKLDYLIEGQRRIEAGLEQLSNQIAKAEINIISENHYGIESLAKWMMANEFAACKNLFEEIRTKTPNTVDSLFNGNLISGIGSLNSIDLSACIQHHRNTLTNGYWYGDLAPERGILFWHDGAQTSADLMERKRKSTRNLEFLELSIGLFYPEKTKNIHREIYSLLSFNALDFSTVDEKFSTFEKRNASCLPRSQNSKASLLTELSKNMLCVKKMKTAIIFF